jgi:hypothetical protein
MFAQGGGWDDYDGRDSLAIGYAIGTLGGRNRSLSLGLGALKASDGQGATPLMMLGGSATVGRHVALVAETWMRVDEEFSPREQALGLGVRFFGERLSADVGVILTGEMLTEGFPIPWGSVTYHFGGGKAAKD